MRTALCVGVSSVMASAVLSFLGAYALLVWAPEGLLDAVLDFEVN